MNANRPTMQAAVISIPAQGYTGKGPPIFRGRVMSNHLAIDEGMIAVGGEWEFRVGEDYEVYLERINRRVNNNFPVRITASPSNTAPITINYHDAITGGDPGESLPAGKGIEIFPTRQRYWIVSSGGPS